VNHSHSRVWNIVQVHSRFNPMIQTTIWLSRLSSSLPLRMHCAHKQLGGLFMGCNVSLKVGKRRWTNVLGFVELIAKKTMDQPTIDQNENKDDQYSNPLQQSFSHNQRKWVEFASYFIFFLYFFLLFYFFALFIYLFFYSFFYHFPFFIFLKLEKEKPQKAQFS